MNVFTMAIDWLKGIWNKMIGAKTIKDVFAVETATSQAMQEGIRTWSDLYLNRAPWLNQDVRGLNLPAAIAGEIARAVTLELRYRCMGSSRADYLSAQLEPVMRTIRQTVEYGEAHGGVILKPYPSDGRISVDVVQADAFFPIAFDGEGNITDVVFIDRRKIGKDYYTRLERHEPTGTGYRITNRAYRSDSESTLGTPVALTSVDDWAGLADDATIENIDRPLFAYFRAPFANNIDPSSPLGVSCYARAVKLIEDADKQWSNLLWEFESGQRALYADITAFQREKDGSFILPNKRLYRALNLDASKSIGDELGFHEWTPTLREANILNGLDAILKRIEFTCGLAYGTISDPNIEAKTATEIVTTRQRSYSTIVDSQKALEQTLNQLTWAMDVYVTLYSMAPAGVFRLSFDFDDSVVVDREAQFSQDLRLVQAGLMSKVEFRMRNMREDEATAKKMIADVQAETPTDLFQGG